ncbi:SsgA family sporulation/cell division regulator [Nocardioides jishulii]|uniref:SsgA family sporulation/cell division regulator n=1 Tax=Nocardioides jishulii TaxID=2575440 RepID=A0A4U2YMQ5_9ACTN|nr:SsgA family sporulation/cell division regulator [Nocardioides jishulii]QCX27743.1 SsgA family sporulation/cell division regulator [Nocardioides jishulii]TKI62549.1 SsgA family sporulation/cell division regulator [Nocardioides jishulii]
MGSRHDRRVAENVVTHDITIQCIDTSGRTHDLDTVFSYSKVDPFAVTVTFLTPEGDLPWTFSRDLLLRGLTTPIGDGDVHVCPSINDHGRAVVIIELSSPDGHLVTEARTDAVFTFVQRSLALVPEGEESQHLSMDAMIEQLLAV